MEYEWGSWQTDALIQKQLQELREKNTFYSEHTTDVSIDNTGQIRASVALTSANGEQSAALASICRVDGQLRICTLNDKERFDRNTQCAEAVRRAIFSTPPMSRWRGKVSGYISSPLWSGEFTMVLVDSLQTDVFLPYNVSVTAGRLSICEFDSGELLVPPAAHNEVRKTCVIFNEGCVEACAVLGQCARQNGTCVASTDEHCRASEVCKRFGNCHAGGKYGNCIAKSDEDCQQLDCGKWKCSFIGETCLKTSKTNNASRSR
jgi:hypothetical protein